MRASRPVRSITAPKHIEQNTSHTVFNMPDMPPLNDGPDFIEWVEMPSDVCMTYDRMKRHLIADVFEEVECVDAGDFDHDGVMVVVVGDDDGEAVRAAAASIPGPPSWSTAARLRRSAAVSLRHLAPTG